MDMKWVFLDSYDRPRSGWRFVFFFLAFMFLAGTLATIGFALLKLLAIPIEADSPWIFAWSGFLMLIAAVIVGWLCGKYLDCVPFRALGLWFTSSWLRHLLLGLLFGAATLALAVLLAFAFGGLRFELNAVDTSAIIYSLSTSFVIFTIAALSEEVLFRGYMLQTFARSGLAAVANGLTSVFFSIVHLRNPSAGNLAALNTILAGIVFGIAYVKTRDLWFVTAMHFMWNWLQAALFGIEVSGLTSVAPAPLLREIDTGPHWLTGESYGLEGGIAATIALVVSFVVIYFAPWFKPDEEMVRLTSPNVYR